MIDPIGMSLPSPSGSHVLLFGAKKHALPDALTSTVFWNRGSGSGWGCGSAACGSG